MSLLDLPFSRAVRRNHAVEHATIHVLTPKYRYVGLAGRADRQGFHLYGRVSTADVQEAVAEALRRLPGEPELAVHPRCGTNLVVGGLMAGLASMAAVTTVRPDRRRGPAAIELLPRLLLAGTGAALVSAGLGPAVQARYTTLAAVGGLELAGIRRLERGSAVVHRVLLREGRPPLATAAA